MSPICDKCNTIEATLLHSFALCPNLHNYWCAISNVFSEVIERHIEPTPLLIIFGTSEHSIQLTNAQQQFLSYGLITAKKLILMFWKKKEAPTLRMWLSELCNTLNLERIRLLLRDRGPQFDQIWYPFICYSGNSRTEIDTLDEF